jgi:hypothetical protein
VLKQLAHLCLNSPEAELPSAPSAWRPFVELAVRHGVAPLLWLRLRERPIPSDARATLQSLFLQNTLRAEKLDAELQRILAAFAARSCKALALKGTQLSASLYGHPAARQVNDIDLLIPPAELEAAEEILTQLGYRRAVEGPLRLFRDAHEILYARRDSAPPLAPEFVFSVDLHQRLLPYSERDLLAKAILERGLTLSLLLLYLCVNQVTHRFSRLKFALDVARHLREHAPRLDWAEFAALAPALDLAPGVFFSLRLAEELSSCRVPEDLMRSLNPGTRDVRRFEKLLPGDAGSVLERASALGGVAAARLILLCTRRGAARARTLRRLLFPPESYLRQELFAAPDERLLTLYLRRLRRKARGLLHQPTSDTPNPHK